jgi:two-component system sensor histidine kinase KdpD
VIATALRRSGDLLKGRDVRVETASDLPLLSLDPVLFEQVLVNLIDNAVRYSPAGTPIAVKASLDDGTVKVEVMDAGPGIAPDDLARVFERFHRAPTERQTAGTGLGLSICKGFVEALGGSIRAANRRDRSGAVLTVTFPAALFIPPGAEAAQ